MSKHEEVKSFENPPFTKLLKANELGELARASFSEYRDVVDASDSLQYLGVTDESEYQRISEAEDTIFGVQDGMNPDEGLFVPVAAKAGLLEHVNTDIIDEDSYIEIVPGSLRSEDARRFEGSFFGVQIASYYHPESDVIFHKTEERKVEGDRDFDIFEDAQIGSTASSVVEAYHVLIPYDQQEDKMEDVRAIIDLFPGEVVELDQNKSPELVEQAYELIRRVVNEQSEDFAFDGDITEDEFDQLVGDKNGFFTKAYVEDGRVKSVVIVGTGLDSIDWFRADKVKQSTEDLRAGSPTYAFEPLLVVSDGPEESNYSVPVFLGSMIELERKANEAGCKESWTMFYECSPRSIFYTPRILTKAMAVGGFVQRNSLVQTTKLVQL